MSRSFAAILILFAVGALPGCENSVDAPTAPDAEFAISAEATLTQQLIEALYPDRGLENAAVKRLRNIERQFSRGQTRAARAQAFELFETILRHHGDGTLIDPNGADAPTRDAATADVLSGILHLVELDGGPIPEGALGPAGQIVICKAGAMCNAAAGDGRAAFHFPAGVTTETTVVAISPLDPMVDPFDAAGLQGFPLYRAFTAIPTLPTDGFDARPVTVEVCMVTPPHPMAPTGDAIDRVLLGRLMNGAGGTVVDLAPMAHIQANFDGAICDGVNGDVPGAGAGGEAETSVSGTMGGAVSGFSIFGAVDPEPANDPPPPPGPETTTDLVLSPSAIPAGTTLLATATVSPAPSAADDPTVTFVIARNTINQRIAVAPVIDGEATVMIGCQSASGFPDPQPDVIVPPGAHFIQAEFPGTSTLDPSQSSTLILSCLP